jgi:predicted MFS family arabinose efflux permease
MENITRTRSDKVRPKWFLLPSLVISSFATQPPLIITGLLLIDIGLTFGYPVGVVGQMRTVASVMSVIIALLMGVLSIRFKHKTMFLTGLLLLSFSALGCYLSQNFQMMLLLYSLTGIGTSMITPMANTIIGEYFPLERRSTAVGWNQAGTSISFLVCSPLVSYVAGLGGWRTTFLAVYLPVSLVAFAISFIGVPGTSHDIIQESDKIGYTNGLKKVFTSRSAVACLMGAMMAMASWSANLTYTMSFFRQSFSMATVLASILLSAMALSKTLGHLISGGLINKLGRKKFMVVSLILLGVSTFIYMNVGFIWLSMVIACLCCMVAGFMMSSMTSLNIEQVPEYRSSMMSLSVASQRIGGTLGTGLGGLILLLHGYGALGAILGLLGLLSAVVYYLFVEDPIGAEQVQGNKNETLRRGHT